MDPLPLLAGALWGFALGLAVGWLWRCRRPAVWDEPEAESHG